MDSLLALSSPKKARELSQRIKRRVTSVGSLEDLLQRLAEEQPLLVIVDIAMPSLIGKQLVDQLRDRLHGDHLVLVNDLANFDPSRLLDALEELAQNRSRKRCGSQLLQPKLHNPDSGRIDARRVAQFFGLSIAKLAKSIGRPSQTVHKTPDSVRLQKELSLFLRIATGLKVVFGTAENSRIWLNTPNPDLDHTCPLQLIERGQGEIVAELLEDILLGHPS